MIIVVSPDGARLEGLEELDRFHISLHAGIGTGDVDAALRQAGLGSLPAGETDALIEIGSIRAEAAGRVSADWEDRFGAMVDFARRHGWISDDGRCIRGHLETAD